MFVNTALRLLSFLFSHFFVTPCHCLEVEAYVRERLPSFVFGKASHFETWPEGISIDGHREVCQMTQIGCPLS